MKDSSTNRDMGLQMTFTFDSAHRLMHHPGKCSNLHGHTYRLEVWISGHIDEVSGMVCDFGVVKPIIKEVCDRWDHKTILSKNDPLVEVFSNNEILLKGLIVFDLGEPTAENMIVSLKQQIQAELPSNLTCTCIKLWETPNNAAHQLYV